MLSYFQQLIKPAYPDSFYEKEALHNAFVFPRSNGVINQEAVVVREMDNLTEWDDFIHEINKNPELIATHVRDELYVVLIHLRTIHSILHLDSYDAIHVCRGKFTYIIINNKRPQLRRTACLDLHEYNRLLMQSARERADKRQMNLLLAVVVAFLGGAVFSSCLTRAG